METATRGACLTEAEARRLYTSHFERNFAAQCVGLSVSDYKHCIVSDVEPGPFLQAVNGKARPCQMKRLGHLGTAFLTSRQVYLRQRGFAPVVIQGCEETLLQGPVRPKS